ncbi:hypothetical protein WA026_023518 [Henosepilachna vigintioctopunctata]|uniref:Uncharacterized protein n=1 Tax=Henosepilachna vigintioctopunctata TaxID=420089 RepID=A0AAW1TTK5_9CUCU
MDSGASNHFVREEVEELMSNIQILKHEVTIQIANAYCLLITVEQEPVTYKKACKIPEWQEAFNKELISHVELKT